MISHLNRRLFLFLIACLSAVALFATHNRAGEITYRHISGFTYEFTITTYTKLSGESEGADRHKLEILWGDDNSDSLNRVAQNPTQYPDVFQNIYVGVHTYLGPLTYIVSMLDPNRIENIINISNSVNTPFYIEDTVIILDPNIIGYNNSPTLSNPPLDAANVGQKFVHNPNAFDIDGDSLVFSLVVPKQNRGITVGGYLSPNQIQPGINNQFTINSRTGEIVWITPQQPGIYNIAILISEYRNGILIGTVVRDMQIFVDETNNKAPVVTVPNNICVIAGDSIFFTVSASDPDIGQLVTLTSNGTIYDLSFKPAKFNAGFPANPIQGSFRWRTDCAHLNKNEYPVLFKAQDNFVTPPLVDIKTVFIKVVAPPPQNFTATVNNANKFVALRWDSLYVCHDNPKFLRFSIWRKIGCNTITDTCNTDLSSQGYIRIAQTTNYSYIDNTIELGNEYSYKVVAEFADVSTFGVELNKFYSLASEEECVKLAVNIPLIYNVDVRNTHQFLGQIYVEWSKPLAQELDTLINPGPYIFQLYRSEGINSTNYTLINTYTFPNYSSITDTSFLDENINTTDFAYNYILLFLANDDTMGYTSDASSVYLTASPNYKSVDLIWNFDVPWSNYSYVIYRKEPGSSTFDSLTTVTTPFYTDTNLMNDSTYCYVIKAIGQYSISGLKQPLINSSQEACAIPNDTTSPCVPILSVDNFCLNSNLSDQEYINYLIWNYDPTCDTSTIIKTIIHYKSSTASLYTRIDSLPKTATLAYSHQLDSKTLAGCYQLETVSKNGKSSFSNIVCVNDCPIYQLPNTFTPNNDGQNDLFVPIPPYRGVIKVDMKIYNRWGVLIFKTENPDINWNGTDSKNNKELNTAVYFYICDVYYQTANGIQKLAESLSGYIHLFR